MHQYLMHKEAIAHEFYRVASFRNALLHIPEISVDPGRSTITIFLALIEIRSRDIALKWNGDWNPTICPSIDDRHPPTTGNSSNNGCVY
jgi:hypothetical protein